MIRIDWNTIYIWCLLFGMLTVEDVDQVLFRTSGAWGMSYCPLGAFWNAIHWSQRRCHADVRNNLASCLTCGGIDPLLEDWF